MFRGACVRMPIVKFSDSQLKTPPRPHRPYGIIDVQHCSMIAHPIDSPLRYDNADVGIWEVEQGQ
jgi:hypothetical protein